MARSPYGIGATMRRSSRATAAPDGWIMNLVEIATAQKAEQVKSDVNVGVLKKMLNQQEQQGEAAVKLINGSGVSRGAPEPGKGRGVDVTA